MKTATLSPLEQRIYFAARNAKDGVVFLEIIRSWRLTDDGTLLFALSKMAKKGWLIRLRNGVYLVSEPSAGAIRDPFAIATYMFPGYLAFSSALYIHGLVDMVPFEVQVATRNESGVRKIGEYSFRAIPLKGRHVGSERKGAYTLSTVPKTLFDCLARPELAGGYPQVLKAIHEARMPEGQWKEFFYYAQKFETSAFYQCLGYLLDIMPEKDGPARKALGLCLKKARSNVYLFKRRKGKYVRKWKLVDDVGSEELLSWWY